MMAQQEAKFGWQRAWRWMLSGMLFILLGNAAAMDRECAQFLNNYLTLTANKAGLAKIRQQPAFKNLRAMIQQNSTYFARSLLSCESPARLEAWQKIWQVVHEAYDLGHQWQLHPALVLALAEDGRPGELVRNPAAFLNSRGDVLARWLVFVQYARVPSSPGFLTAGPTLQDIRMMARHDWPRGKIMRPAEDLTDFEALLNLWSAMARYLSGHPAKSLTQVLNALNLRMEITQHLLSVAPRLGLTRPPMVSGLLAETNSFKNQMRLLQQAARKHDFPLALKRLAILRAAYGISWIAIMDKAKLSLEIKQQLWAFGNQEH